MEKVEKIKKLDSMKDIYEKLGYALGSHLIPNGCWHCMLERSRIDKNMPFCHKSLEVEEGDLISFKPFDYLHCPQNEWIEHLWPTECKEFIETLAIAVNARDVLYDRLESLLLHDGKDQIEIADFLDKVHKKEQGNALEPIMKEYYRLLVERKD